MTTDMAYRASLNLEQGTPQIVTVDKTNATKTIKAIGEAKNNAAVSGMAFVYPGTCVQEMGPPEMLPAFNMQRLMHRKSD